MISRDGWMPKLVAPTKKSVKWTDLSCDLLPIELAIKKFLPELKAELDGKESALENLQEEMNMLLEDNEENFQENLFYNKLNAKNIRTKLEHCSAVQLTENDLTFLQSLMPYFERNCKANREAVARLVAERSDLFTGIDTVTKKVVNNLISASANWEYSTAEQRELWAQYVDMLDAEALLKKEIKELSAQMLKEIVRVYAEISAEVVKPIIIADKWLADIKERISREMDNATHGISTDVTLLAERYENTLESLNAIFVEKEAAVLNHLKEMGFGL
jgi:type I restriction enzyme M protein